MPPPVNIPPIIDPSSNNQSPPSSPVNIPPIIDPSSSSPLSSPPSSPVNVVDPSSNDPGYIVTNQQYADASGNQRTETQFITTEPTSDVQITQDLSGNVIKYYDSFFFNDRFWIFLEYMDGGCLTEMLDAELHT